MSNRRLKYNGRRKAAFGAEAAAILAAAGINAATQLTAAGINSSATKQAAKDQAAAINTNAQRQAQAIKDQTERSREYQQQNQEFIREENAENRELQKDIQMQLQMLTGQQNVNDRLEAAKLKVRNGGKTRPRLKNAGMFTSSLRGSYNMPFVVTDGGGVVPLGVTPEGYELYELYGNDHEHYHKAQRGKAKTGVGIRFADGNIVEGEGNQNTHRGEKMLVTPDNAYFISKHTLKGFNPANAVDEGMNPLLAYSIQEDIKARNNITDDGKSSPVERMLMGGDTNDILYDEALQPNNYVTGNVAVGVAADNQNKRRLRCGGNSKRKAYAGLSINTYNPKLNSFWTQPWLKYNPNNTSTNTSNTTSNTSTNTPNTRSVSAINNYSDLIGAGIGALGNLGGALITSIGNRRAASTLADAYNTSSNMLADAYRQLQTIDTNNIRREDYAAAHAMPALQAPVSFAAANVAGVDRQLQRRLANAGRYSASSAAAQDRMRAAEVDAQDMRNKIYSADQEQMQNIRQANAQRVSEAAMENAKLDTAANQQYANAYLDMLQYNNDIVNQRILGAAGALSEGTLSSAGALANAQTSNAQAWSNALVGSSQGFTNSLSAMADRKAKVAAALLGANSDSQANYYANLATKSEAKTAYDALRRQYNATTNTEDKNILRRRINTIAAGQGFDIIS